MTPINLTTQGCGMPLVLFHGWGFDSQIWRAILPSLSATHTVYLVDLPGFGETPYMDWDTFKERVLLQLPAQFSVVGWSMGGLFATRLALEASSRVTHVVNIASSPRFIQDIAWPGIAPAVFDDFYDQLVQDPVAMLRQFQQLQLQGQPLVSSSNHSVRSLTGLKAGLDCLLMSDFRGAIQGITQPMLYLFGRLDAIVPRKTMTVMRDQYPQCHYHLFSDSAHMPFLSQSVDFIRILEDFLQ